MSGTSSHVLNFTQVYIKKLIFGQPFWAGYFLFLNGEFTHSSLKISRTVKKTTKSESSKFKNYLHVGPPY